MDKDYCHDKMMELLSDRETYQELNSNIDKQKHNKIKKLTARYKNNLTAQKIKYLTNFNYQDSNLYGLPKVHKSKTITEKIKSTTNQYIIVHRPSNLKMYPMCAGPKRVTNRLSNLIDILLKHISNT